MLPHDLAPLSEDLTYLSPMSHARADELVAWLAEGLGPQPDRGPDRRPDRRPVALDAGCGWGELALRVAVGAPAAHVVGVDLDAERVAQAGRRAIDLGVSDRTDFLVGDASLVGPDEVDALVAIGASQVWGTATGESLPLAYAAALAGIRARVRRGARVAYGEAVWTRSPTPAATAALSGRDDEFVALADVVTLAETHGFACVEVGEASLAEWDAFESGFTARFGRWLAEHEPGHPAAEEVRARSTQQREGYLRGYRGVLGMAYLRLLAL